jgi:hypothetical protein
MLKDLIKFTKFKYGRVVKVAYWVDQPPSPGVFPNKTLYKLCIEHEVDLGKTFGHEILDISRAHIVSSMGAFMEGVLHPSFAMQHFSKPFYLSLIYYGTNIECFVHGKKRTTTTSLEVRIH